MLSLIFSKIHTLFSLFLTETTNKKRYRYQFQWSSPPLMTHLARRPWSGTLPGWSPWSSSVGGGLGGGPGYPAPSPGTPPHPGCTPAPPHHQPTGICNIHYSTYQMHRLIHTKRFYKCTFSYRRNLYHAIVSCPIHVPVPAPCHVSVSRYMHHVTFCYSNIGTFTDSNFYQERYFAPVIFSTSHQIPEHWGKQGMKQRMKYTSTCFNVNLTMTKILAKNPHLSRELWNLLTSGEVN